MAMDVQTKRFHDADGRVEDSSTLSPLRPPRRFGYLMQKSVIGLTSTGMASRSPPSNVNTKIEDPDLSGSVSRYRLFASWTVGTISGNPTAKGDSSLTPTGCKTPVDATPFLIISRPHGSKKKKGDLVLYSGDLFPTEARKPPSCPRSHSVNRKGKPTHPSAPLVDRCGFTKRLSTVHSR
ncbi:hypothetical protein RIF29_47715 [Crotalaria pallida]|uniref:Uncharacterized protein n=1 Tax=Crotalaria pallida TaxID=3830 RepID=A0AAN9DWR1_CROPI